MSKKILAVILVAALLVFARLSEAQQPGKVPTIGFLSGTSASAAASNIEAFRQALRNLGYIEGKNITIEWRFAERKFDRLSELAVELVRIEVDIIVASTDQGARAAKNATKTIPVVIVSVGTDPVEAGLVESLARPGGNVTGLTNLGVETAGKRLELLKETVPKIARVAVLYDPANRGSVLALKEVQAAARPLGLTVQSWEVLGTDDFETVFAAIGKARPDGLFVGGGALMVTNEKRTAAFALKRRLPSAYNRREAAEAGGLMAYGTYFPDLYRRAATYVDRILKGTKPADLPVERPMKFELVINLNTAKQIGLTIPPNVLARADKVIK